MIKLAGISESINDWWTDIDGKSKKEIQSFVIKMQRKEKRTD